MAIAEEAARSIRAYRDKPFALFGHSMGALICFELAQYLKRAGEREPQWLFVSGRRAPHIPYADPVSYNLPEAAFLWELEKLRGTPPELLKNSELLQLILPTLRADFEACQTYKCSSDTQELSCPITVFGGLADEISPEQLKGWRHYSTGRFQIHLLPGDHFYVRTEENRLTSLIADQLSPICYGHSGPITGDLRCEGI